MDQVPVKRTKFTDNGKKCKKNWTDCYMVLTQTALIFYKDQKTYNASVNKNLIYFFKFTVRVESKQAFESAVVLS